MTAERRIRALHLTVPEERWIGRGALLVEDALRTASLPWADAGRLLLVRAVDLGTIPAGAAPSTVALALEMRLREVTVSAVHAGQADAPHASAVWFRDAAEAHALLAVRLARGEKTTAWFWPLAVPAWQWELPRGAALRAVLLGALDTPAGPAAVGEVVRALWEAGKIDELAAALAPEDGPKLERACGSRPAAVRGAGALVLARWAGEWGSDDARSVWLGTMLRRVKAASGPHPPATSPIAPPAPGRGGEPSPTAPLPRAGEGRTAELAKEGESTFPLSRRKGGRWERGPGGEVSEAAVSTTAAPERLVPRTSEPGSPHRRDASWGVSEVVGSRLIPSEASASPAGHPADPTAGAAAETPHGASLQWGGTRGDLPASEARKEIALAQDGGVLPQPPSVPAGQPFHSPRFQPGAVPGVSPGARPEVSPGTGREADPGTDSEADPEAAPGAPPRVSTDPGRLASPHAGLFFLLPVLAHTGLPAFLEGSPHLQDAGFPARFLDHMARRLGAPVDDPVRQALFVEDGEIAGEAALFKAWRIAVRRWCRLRARIGLSDLIRRPGHVVATRTHVDVFFDPRVVEMRVRRSGLDLDPGWVSWLGRVVLFHYEQPPEVLHVG